MRSKNISACYILVGFVAAAVCASSAFGQQFSIPWYTIDGGGGFSSGGSFELEGTIGQPDAGEPMTGASFTMTGGFWTQTVETTTQIAPQSFLVTRGTFVSGGIPELANSDNADLSIRRAASDIQSRTEFEVSSVSPVANPASMQVTLEGAVFARSQVNQIIELFNFLTNNWEQVDSRSASRLTDTTVTVTATGNLARFVEAGTRSIEARIRYQSVNPRQQFSSNTDHFFWTIIP
jgi:hypothetical protein